MEANNAFKEFVQFIVTLILGMFLTIAILTHFPQKEFKSKVKINPDYELEAKDKVVDTVWIYKIK